MINGRDLKFDIAKGIGIILMVYAHTYAYGKTFIYLFHMAFFFIIAGYFFNPKHSESFNAVKSFVKNKWVKLALPFIIFNSIYLLLNNFFIDTNIYTDNPLISDATNITMYNSPQPYLSQTQIIPNLFKILFLSYGTQLGGATWFLRVLFWVTISYSFVYYLFKKLYLKDTFFSILNFLICSACIAVGAIMQHFNINFYTIGTMFTCVTLYYIGILFRQFSNKNVINNYSFICSLIVLFVGNYYHLKVAISTNIYPNILVFLLLSIAGYIVIMHVSTFLNNIKHINKLLVFIGQNTMPIILLHFLAFKLITYVQICLYGLPKFYLASFPILYNKPYWFIFYTIAGIFIPISLNFCMKKFFAKFLIFKKVNK